MEDRKFTFCGSSANCWAWGLSVTTGLLMLTATLLDSPSLRGWGLACSAAAATAWIRKYFIRHNEVVEQGFRDGQAMMERMFSFGMEAGRVHAQSTAKANGAKANGHVHQMPRR